MTIITELLASQKSCWKLASQKSSWRRINRGCPQGSMLGPLLLNVFQNDLAYEIDQNLSMYADDHQLYEINENVPTVNHNLNANATKASVWYKSNLLKGNLSKYHTIPVTNKQVGNEFGVRVQGTDIECLNSFKLLGVIIDNNTARKIGFTQIYSV